MLVEHAYTEPLVTGKPRGDSIIEGLFNVAFDSFEDSDCDSQNDSESSLTRLWTDDEISSLVDVDTSTPADTGLPFQKWIKSIHRRAHHRSASYTNLPRRYRDPNDRLSKVFNHPYEHRHSSSGSSYAFVTTIKSASISLSSGSDEAPTAIKLRGPGMSRQASRGYNSQGGTRHSEDTERPSVVDMAAQNRSLQRRRILDEMISTEEDYIGDIRFLISVSDVVEAAASVIC